jgi:hypothetical protein
MVIGKTSVNGEHFFLQRHSVFIQIEYREKNVLLSHGDEITTVLLLNCHRIPDSFQLIVTFDISPIATHLEIIFDRSNLT